MLNRNLVDAVDMPFLRVEQMHGPCSVDDDIAGRVQQCIDDADHLIGHVGRAPETSALLDVLHKTRLTLAELRRKFAKTEPSRAIVSTHLCQGLWAVRILLADGRELEVSRHEDGPWRLATCWASLADLVAATGRSADWWEGFGAFMLAAKRQSAKGLPALWIASAGTRLKRWRARVRASRQTLKEEMVADAVRSLAIPESLKNRGLIRLPFGSGVYFLAEDSRIVYVGKSINGPSGRIADHRRKDWRFDFALWLPVDKADLALAERKYIAELKPKYNRAGNPVYSAGKPARRRLDPHEQEA